MENQKWLSYNELAWLEPIIAPFEDYAKETEHYCTVLREYSKIEPKTLLHLGSGAGINDYTFKKHFEVTGVDISKGMLEVAERLNPEVAYHFGDMRTVRLGKVFDAVIIPESINYMTTAEDMGKAILTAYKHLKPGGVFLFVTHIKEEFTENNFVYTGTKGDLKVTVFENNYYPDPEGTTYEATIVYLVRRGGKLDIYNDRHVIGLFRQEIWLEIIKATGFEVQLQKQEDTYTPYILGEGKYPLQMFICTRPL